MTRPINLQEEIKGIEFPNEAITRESLRTSLEDMEGISLTKGKVTSIKKEEDFIVDFSPDIDVFAVNTDGTDGNEIISYEVKGYNNKKITKGQLYSGIGQAKFNLLSKIKSPNNNIPSFTGIIKRSYLALPKKISDLDKETVDFLNKLLKKSYIGLVLISYKEIKVISEAKVNPYYNYQLSNKLSNAIKNEKVKIYNEKIHLGNDLQLR